MTATEIVSENVAITNFPFNLKVITSAAYKLTKTNRNRHFHIASVTLNLLSTKFENKKKNENVAQIVQIDSVAECDSGKIRNPL